MHSIEKAQLTGKVSNTLDFSLELQSSIDRSQTLTNTRKDADVLNGGLGLSHGYFKGSSNLSIIRANDEDPFLQVPASEELRPRPAFSAVHATTTIQGKEDDRNGGEVNGGEVNGGEVNDGEKESTLCYAHHHDLFDFGSLSSASSKTSHGFIAQNVADVLVAMKDETGFIIIVLKSKFVEGEDLKLNDPDKRDRIQVPKVMSHFTHLHEGQVESAPPAESNTGSGFTPLIKQTEYFARLERARQAKQLISADHRALTLHDFNKEYSKALSTVLPKVMVIKIQGLEERINGQTGSAQEESLASQLISAATLVTKATFIFFSRLPAELQLAIWKLTLPGPRTVAINVSKGQKVFRPVHASIPPILQVCQASRALALTTIHQSFSTGQPGSVLYNYNYFDPTIDTLKLSLENAKRIANGRVPAHVKLDREKTRHVEIQFPIFCRRAMWEAMAELVLSSTHRAWPSIQSWLFPGEPKEGKPEADRKEIVSLVVKRPTSMADGEDVEGRKELASLIGEKMRKGRREFGTLTQVGISISYN